MIKAAVIGYGNIGSGVVSVLRENEAAIRRQAGDAIVPVCVLDLRDFPGDVMEHCVVRDIREICGNPEIRIVVETMGGEHPAFEYVDACLRAGKHVITSNKALVAAFGPRLFQTARENRVNFLFEASVGGAIPIIRPLISCITGDPVREITGILNGTTNYMLTQMSEQGAEYQAALETAQELGFAERNPEADVEGFDACRKIAILSSLAFGGWVDYRKIDTTGITGISKGDILAAKAFGFSVKLLGRAKMETGTLYARVSPACVGPEHPLFAVNGVMNAVLVRGDKMGDLMFYGAGAGKLPTASAVVADMVSAARHPEGGEIPFVYEEELCPADACSEKNAYVLRFADASAEFTAEYGIREIRELPNGEFAGISVPMTGLELAGKREKYPMISAVLLA